MALSKIDYAIFRTIREQNIIPLDGDILELGEANWYGDVDLNRLAQDIYHFVPESARQALRRQLDEIVQTKRQKLPFEVAKVFWSTFLQPRSMTAIDFHGTEQALKLNLNSPINMQRQFNVVMNIGTAEHVFNVAQVFKTIHDHTMPNGFMVHGLPFTGWVDHGFFNFQPTFYWDLAAANDYKIKLAIYAELKPLKLVQLHGRTSIIEAAKNGEIGNNSMIYFVMQKQSQENDFQIPIQGYYAEAIPQEAIEAWQTLR